MKFSSPMTPVRRDSSNKGIQKELSKFMNGKEKLLNNNVKKLLATPERKDFFKKLRSKLNRSTSQSAKKERIMVVNKI